MWSVSVGSTVVAPLTTVVSTVVTPVTSLISTVVAPVIPVISAVLCPRDPNCYDDSRNSASGNQRGLRLLTP